MKKKIVIISIFLMSVIIFLNFYNDKEYFSTTNVVIVLEKNNNERFVITVNDKDYTTRECVDFNIYLKNENVWNLIEVNQTYFVVYSKNDKGEFILNQIEKFDIID